MAKKDMNQDLFDVCASSLASMEYSKTDEFKNHRFEDLLNLIKPSYEKYIIDDGVWEEVLITAKKIQKLVRKSIFTGDMLSAYTEDCFKFTAKGKKHPLFNGHFFRKFKKSINIPNKKENSLKRAKEYFILNFGIDILASDKKVYSKKPKKKKPKITNLKKDVEWIAERLELKKLDKNKIIQWDDGYTPKQQYKSTRKFPLTSWWIFIEKHHNNKFKAYLRKLTGRYWENYEWTTGYCKNLDSAWDSLYKKLNKDE
jgi:hypothetical protein